MPRKNNNTPEVRQMQRENQRRARTRQKEMIDGMRLRLDQYERDGIQATLAMQASARLVAAENQCLRNLLTSRGVSNDDVEVYLNANIADSTARLPFIHASHQMPHAFSHPKDGHIEGRSGTWLPSTHSGHHAHNADGKSQLASADDGSREGSITRMACDVAVSIVADVQGHDDHGYVRSALGCTTPNCSVQTSRVFDIIDRATL